MTVFSMVTGQIAEMLLFVCSAVCNGLNIAESEVYWALYFKLVIDSWGTRSDENIKPGAILFF